VDTVDPMSKNDYHESDHSMIIFKIHERVKVTCKNMIKTVKTDKEVEEFMNNFNKARM